MYDILSSHKVCNMRTLASQDAGSTNNLVINLQEAVTAALGQYERTSRGLLIIGVTSVAAGGLLDIVVQDSLEEGSGYDTDFATIEQIDSVGYYVVDLKNIQRYMYLRSTVSNAAVVWGAIFIGFDAERRPVQQSDTTELDVTYGTGR